MDFDYVVVPALILLIGILVIWLSVRRILSLAANVSAKWRRATEKIVLSAVVLFAVAVAGCSSFNAAARLWFRAHNPPPGEIYAVDGYKMHMYCTGSGSPTIVLDAGLGNDASIWAGVQRTLAKTTRVYAYDRAGFGWSEARPAPRDADHIAAELHGLLLQGQVSRPILLMGHSIAGIYMRDYAAHYPKDLAGMVFVDSCAPFQDKKPAMKGGGAGRPPWVVRLAMSAGVPRLLGMCSWGAPGVDGHTSKLQGEASCGVHFSAISAEMNNIDRSSQEAVQPGTYGGLPILIISHDPAKETSKNPTQNGQNAWSQMQEDLKKLSTRSRRIIAKGSAHNIMFDRPDLIDTEVPRFVDQLRGTVPQPTDYGSTITE